MNFRIFVLSLGWLFLSAPSFAFVHISALKPRLPVSPASPVLTFYWNGDSPPLQKKEELFDGAFADSSDQEMLEAILNLAVNTWNAVPTAYIELKVELSANAIVDENDETFSIVVDAQDSELVAAASLPSFLSNDPNPSERERDPHIIHDCDIALGTHSVSAKSLLKTIVHELGHCLGLGHPHSSYDSIMSYANLSDKAKLSLDDKAGISFLYPEPSESEQVRYLTQCGVAGSQGEATRFWLWLPLLCMFLGSCLRRLRMPDVR